MVVSVPILLPALHPVIQPLWRSGSGWVGSMEVMELVRAVLEVGCVIPLRIVVVAKPFHAVFELSPSPKNTGRQNLLNLIFVFFIPLGGKSRFGRGARRWSALTLKP